MVKKIIILMAALCLVLVGISCKKKPTEAGGMELKAPKDKNDVIGGTEGRLDPNDSKNDKYTNEMINIRLITDSGDGEAYYRSPVVVTYGANGMGMGLFYEKRYGQGGANDVGVDGKARVDIVFMANSKGGDNLTYSSDTKVGSDTSAKENAQYSKGSPIVFANKSKVSVIASAGTGATGQNGSELKIATGTPSGDTISFGGWKELDIKYTPDGGTEKNGSEAIRNYIKDKIDSKYHGFYTRWGRGKIDPNNEDKWVFTLWAFGTGSETGYKSAVLVLYSENAGGSWKFGPHYNELNENSGYARATALSVSGDTVKVSLVPNTANRPLGIISGTLSDSSATATTFNSGITTSSFNDSYNNSEISAPYFINTREKNAEERVNGFVVNRNLTIASLNGSADDLKEKTSMMMSRVSGSGSVAVLDDGTIVTLAEEAFAENAIEGQNRFNIVQRRFTESYLNSHKRINENEEYYNKNK